MNPRDFATSVARDGGKAMLAHFELGMSRKTKADGSVVTDGDLVVEKIVVQGIREEFPDDGILGEEGSDISSRSGYVWVLDPIDGTLHYSHSIPVCMLSLARVLDGEPVLGLLYDPFLHRLFVAEKEKGATLNGLPIRVSTRDNLQHATVGLGSIRAEFHHLSPDLYKAGAAPVPLFSIAYLAALVAAGEFVGAYFRGKNAWDVAAGKIMVEEAGGRVTDLRGNSQRYDGKVRGAIFSNSLVHDNLLRILGD